MKEVLVITTKQMLYKAFRNKWLTIVNLLYKDCLLEEYIIIGILLKNFFFYFCLEEEEILIK